MKIEDLMQAQEMLDYSEENLSLCIAEVKNELILDGCSPYNYIISPAYKDAAENVTFWRGEVKRIAAMPLQL